MWKLLGAQLLRQEKYRQIIKVEVSQMYIVHVLDMISIFVTYVSN